MSAVNTQPGGKPISQTPRSFLQHPLDRLPHKDPQSRSEQSRHEPVETFDEVHSDRPVRNRHEDRRDAHPVPQKAAESRWCVRKRGRERGKRERRAGARREGPPPRGTTATFRAPARALHPTRENTRVQTARKRKMQWKFEGKKGGRRRKLDSPVNFERVQGHLR